MNIKLFLFIYFRNYFKPCSKNYESIFIPRKEVFTETEANTDNFVPMKGYLTNPAWLESITSF